MRSWFHRLAAVACAALVGTACASSSGRVVQATPPVVVAPAAPVELPPPSPVVVDHVAEMLAAVDRHFEEGRRELALGHLTKARVAFNASVEMLLESELGASDGRVRAHFDRLVDRIAALELTALSTGDAFTERATEPASIDDLLELSTADVPPPTPATIERVEADLETTVHDLPIPLNDRVLRWVEIFQNRLREFLQAGLQRGSQYLPMIQNVFRAEGLPLDLAYVPLIESAFKPTALSRAKAKGVWQFMAGTGLENGLKQDWYIDERSDPAKATVAAAKYFKTLHGMFDDWHLAMASYNGGPYRVMRAVKRSGKDDFWTLSARAGLLPRETRDYVPMILAAVIIARNPRQYGFTTDAFDAPPIETVDVPAAVDLRRVAEFAGVPVEEIQRLNPELRRWTTPIRGPYTLAVPVGTADAVRRSLAEVNPGSLNALQWHVVKRGETLSTIARKHRVSRADLAEANYLKSASKLANGHKLVIPRMPSAALLARAASGQPVDLAEVTASTLAPDTTDDPIVYRVKSGDTLYSIARRHQTTVEKLRALNRISGSNLKVGARLLISSSSGTATQQ